MMALCGVLLLTATALAQTAKFPASLYTYQKPSGPIRATDFDGLGRETQAIELALGVNLSSVKTVFDSSAKLRAILGDETGSGAACFANTPTLTTPIIAYYTVATLPPVDVAAPGRVAIVVDGLTAGSCTTGGGVFKTVCRDNGTVWESIGGASGGGSGTVTSVALSVPVIFNLSGSPIATSGTLGMTLATQSANRIFAGPSSGSAAAPGFRSMVDADLPSTATLDIDWNTSAKIASNVTDVTGTAGALVMSIEPTLTNPVIGSYTVATLPSASGADGRIALVIDSLTGSCAVGGGSNKVWCRDNGASWGPIAAPTVLATTPTPTLSATPTRTPTRTVTPATATISPTPTVTITKTPTPTLTATPTVTLSGVTATPTPFATPTPGAPLPWLEKFFLGPFRVTDDAPGAGRDLYFWNFTSYIASAVGVYVDEPAWVTLRCFTDAVLTGTQQYSFRFAINGVDDLSISCFISSGGDNSVTCSRFLPGKLLLHLRVRRNNGAPQGNFWCTPQFLWWTTVQPPLPTPTVTPTPTLSPTPTATATPTKTATPTTTPTP